ncbi:MAG: hypothetical protein ABI725_02495 [Chloroflexota bacterium]
MNEDGQIDLELRVAGERWRASRHSTPARVDPAMFTEKRSTGMLERTMARAAQVLAAVTVVAFVGVIFVLLVRPGLPPGPAATSPTGSVGPAPTTSPTTPAAEATATAGPSQSTAPSPTPAPVTEALRNGDSVTARGVVMGSDQDELRICKPEGSLQSGHLNPTPPMTPACPEEVSVAVIGVSAATLPGWTPVGSGGQSAYIDVHGTWSGRAIVVESAELVVWRPTTDRQAPCSSPPEGWPGEPPGSIDGETNLRQLSDAVAAAPDQYIGYWAAFVDPVKPELGRVMVVGTVGDVNSAREELRLAYPYNLCVVAVEHSAADLQSIADALGPFTVAWRPEVDEANDTVSIWLPYVDDAALNRVGQFAEAVTFDPLVAKDAVP